ncbi:MAG TPA: hypothetical protein VE974_13890 [Thermoanaerobaculia bacterium]|nr:hypothetical protein [Thermoanaerobaculia bacterium]
MNEYKVQIVGLAYFLPEPGQRHVLFPDGRNVPNVVPHLATIAVAADDLAGNVPLTGWSDDQIMRTPVNAFFSGTGADRELLQFVLDGDSIEIEGASVEETDEPLDTRAHDNQLQPLTRGASGARVSISAANANTVADVQIRRGSLHAFRYPGSNNDGTGAIISELRVPYDRDTVTITVRPKQDEKTVSSSSEDNVRTITVKNGSEIALVNASRPDQSDLEDETDHFGIYGQLAPGRLSVGTPRATPIPFPRSRSEHLLFLTPGAIGSSVKCNNTCC